MQATVFLKLDGAEAQAVQMNDLVLDAPSVVHLDISPEDVARFDRNGQDLVLVLKSGQTVVIRNFFVKDGAERSELVFEDEAGAVWQVAYDDAFTNVHITEVSAAANPVWFPAWSQAAFGAGLLGVLGICLTMAEKEPKPSIAIIDNTSPATEGTPDRIVSTLDNQEAVALSGLWTPGGTVNQIVITDGAGNSVTVPEADITVNPDGSYTTTADLSGLEDGTLIVTGTFTNPDNGKILTAQTTILKDVINEVTIDPITIDEGVLSVITGTAEPLINVTLTIGNNPPVVVKADANGVWSYTLPAPQGYLDDLAISATTTDKAGNRADDSRDLGALWVTNDPTAPSAGLSVSESGLPDGTTEGDVTKPDAHIVGATLQLVKPGNPVESITFDPKLAGGRDPAPVVFTPAELTAASATAPLVVDTAFGTITITGFDPVTGTMSYVYSLDDDIDHPNGTGTLSEAVKITVLEVDGDKRLQTLTLHVQDDGVIGVAGPQAVVTEADTTAASGNLLTGAEGADGPEVNKIFYTGSNGLPAEATMGTSNLVLKTQHGTLTVKPDGDWTYLPDTSVKNPVSPVHGTGDDATDNFSFTLKDSDGSVSPVVTQEIVIKDTTPAITGPATGAVSEAYLPGNVLPDSAKLVTRGTLAVTAGKDAHLVTLAGTLTDSQGTPITLTSNGKTVLLDWGPAPTGGEPAQYHSVSGYTLDNGIRTPVFDMVLTNTTGVPSYSFTLKGTLDHNQADALPLVFPFTVTDTDGDAPESTITINVFDAKDNSVVALTGPEDHTGVSHILVGAQSDVFVVNGTPLTGTTSNGILTMKTPNGTITVTAAGVITYKPDAHFSGSETYSVIKTSGSTTVVTATTTPVADAPTVPTVTVSTLEDTAVALGLTVPALIDTDRSERLGVITITGPAGAVLKTASGTDILNGAGTVKIILTDSPDIVAVAHWPTDAVRMTMAQYQGLLSTPPTDSHADYLYTVTATVHEVDPVTFAPRPEATATAQTSADVTVRVQAVTDDVGVEWKKETEIDALLSARGTDPNDADFAAVDSYDAARKSLGLHLREDEEIDITPMLSSLIAADANRTGDTSETRWITVTNPATSGGSIIVNGTPLAPGHTSANIPLLPQDGLPEITIAADTNFSGQINDLVVTIHAQDIDADGFINGTTTSPAGSDGVAEANTSNNSVNLSLKVHPVLDLPTAAKAALQEDTAAQFLHNIDMGDRTPATAAGGVEIFTELSFTPPAGWIVQPLDQSSAHFAHGQFTYAAGTFTITFSANATQAQREAYLDLWKILPPPQSSINASMIVALKGQDSNGSVVTTGTSNVAVTLSVTPVAERLDTQLNTTDMDRDGTPDLTMTPGHTYDASFVREDEWFVFNQEGFQLEAGWSNDDDVHGAANTVERTFARLTPFARPDGSDGELVRLDGAVIRYKDANGVYETVTITAGKQFVDVPMEYLNTVEFQGPPYFSGPVEVKVVAYTTDPDDDRTEGLNNAISGEAWLRDILVLPKINPVTVAVDGAAVGNEDSRIPLSIRPRSDDTVDGSEVFKVTISGLPAGATLYYDGTAYAAPAGSGATFAVTIPKFDSSKKLEVLPPKDSNEHFELKVETEVNDSVTVTRVTDTDNRSETIAIDPEDLKAKGPFAVTFTGNGTDLPVGTIIHFNGQSHEVTAANLGQPFTVTGVTNLHAPMIVTRPDGLTGNLALKVDIAPATGPVKTQLLSLAEISGAQFAVLDTAATLPDVTISGIPAGSVITHGNATYALDPSMTAIIIPNFDPLKITTITRPVGSDDAFTLGIAVAGADVPAFNTNLAVEAQSYLAHLKLPDLANGDWPDVTLKDVPAGFKIMLGNDVYTGGTGDIVIPAQGASMPLKLFPPAGYTGTTTIGFTSEGNVANGTITFTTDGTTSSVTVATTYADEEGPLALDDLTIDVQVTGVPDPAVVIVTSIQGGTGKQTEKTYVEDGTTSITLSQLMSGVDISDEDGSEVPTIQISGLPADMDLKGAMLLSGSGASRIWVVNATTAALDAVTVTVPKNFSGRVTFVATPMTTENDGAEGASAASNVSFLVTAVPEAVMTTSGTIKESSAARDQAQNIGLDVVARNGDTDETVGQVGILTSYADTADFTLFLIEYDGAGNFARQTPLTGLQTEMVNGKEYYILSPEQVKSLGALGDAHLKGDLGSFEFIYKAADTPVDASHATVISTTWTASNFNVIASEVTDPVTLTFDNDDITGAVDVTDRQIGSDPQDTIQRVTVKDGPANTDRSFSMIFTAATPDTNAAVAESVTRLVIENVPAGTSVEGAEYMGNGNWILVYDNNALTYANNMAQMTVNFRVALSGAEVQTVKTTVTSVDANGATSVQSVLNWELDTSFSNAGPGPVQDLIESWVANPVTLTEDTAKSLGGSNAMFTGKLKASGSSAFLLTLLLEGLPEGALVQSTSGAYKTILTQVNGKDVWTVSIEIPANSSAAANQALLDAMLAAIEVQTPRNGNSQQWGLIDPAQPELGNKPFSFNGKLASYEMATGNHTAIPALSSSEVAPLTDGIAITVTHEGAVVSEDATELPFTITLSNTADRSFSTILGDTVFVDIAGLMNGTIRVGNVDYVATEVLAGSPMAAYVTPGFYYQLPTELFDATSFSTTLAASFIPAPNTALPVGPLVMDVTVVGQETNAQPLASTQTHEITIVANHDHVESGMDNNIAINGLEAQGTTNQSLIEITPSFTLNDTNEAATLVKLTGVPTGFLIYTGTSQSDATLAISGGGGSWILSNNGTMPDYVAILPPRYWSGEITTMQLSVTSGEVNMSDEARDLLGASVTDVLPMPNVVVAPVLSGFGMKPTAAFGVAGEEVPLNFNAVLKDAVGGTPETITMTFTGLDPFAKFIANGVALGADKVFYDGTRYVLRDLTLAQVNSLKLVQKETTGTPTINVLAIAKDGDLTGPSVNASFTLQMMPNTRDAGADNDLAWTGQSLDGGAGDDTVHARFAMITGADLSAVLRNIEVLDLTIAGSNTITGLTPDDVFVMTDTRSSLALEGNADDVVNLSGDWTDNGNGTYTGTLSSGSQVTLTSAGAVGIAMPAPQGRMMSFDALFMPDAPASEEEEALAALPAAQAPEALQPVPQAAAADERDIADLLALAETGTPWQPLDELALSEI